LLLLVQILESEIVKNEKLVRGRLDSPV
jgi:hypothetical protein